MIPIPPTINEIAAMATNTTFKIAKIDVTAFKISVCSAIEKSSFL
jgi:hypothetical protein